MALGRVKELHAKATRVHKETAAHFKNLFIKLLTDATHSAAKPGKPSKIQQEPDDDAEDQAQKRADEERDYKRREQLDPSPGAGGGDASGVSRSEGQEGR